MPSQSLTLTPGAHLLATRAPHGSELVLYVPSSKTGGANVGWQGGVLSMLSPPGAPTPRLSLSGEPGQINLSWLTQQGAHASASVTVPGDSPHVAVPHAGLPPQSSGPKHPNLPPGYKPPPLFNLQIPPTPPVSNSQIPLPPLFHGLPPLAGQPLGGQLPLGGRPPLAGMPPASAPALAPAASTPASASAPAASAPAASAPAAAAPASSPPVPPVVVGVGLAGLAGLVTWGFLRWRGGA